MEVFRSFSISDLTEMPSPRISLISRLLVLSENIGSVSFILLLRTYRAGLAQVGVLGGARPVTKRS
jgi:hypothetical protein